MELPHGLPGLGAQDSAKAKLVAAAQAGEILIKEGDTGLGASELYVVKEGEFEVLERRQGAHPSCHGAGATCSALRMAPAPMMHCLCMREPSGCAWAFRHSLRIISHPQSSV